MSTPQPKLPSADDVRKAKIAISYRLAGTSFQMIVGPWHEEMAAKIVADVLSLLQSSASSGANEGDECRMLVGGKSTEDRLGILRDSLSDPSHGEQPVAGRYRHSSRSWEYSSEKPEGPSAHLFKIEPIYATPQQSGWRSDMENAPKDGRPVLAMFLWYPHGLDGREEYAERNADVMRWIEHNGGGWVHYVLGTPYLWKPIDLPTAPSEQKL